MSDLNGSMGMAGIGEVLGLLREIKALLIPLTGKRLGPLETPAGYWNLTTVDPPPDYTLVVAEFQHDETFNKFCGPAYFYNSAGEQTAKIMAGIKWRPLPKNYYCIRWTRMPEPPNWPKSGG